VTFCDSQAKPKPKAKALWFFDKSKLLVEK